MDWVSILLLSMSLWRQGHVHFWGADLELCLRNPLAPVRVSALSAHSAAKLG